MPSLHGIKAKYLVFEELEEYWSLRGSGKTAQEAIDQYLDRWVEGDYVLVKVLPVTLAIEEE